MSGPYHVREGKALQSTGIYGKGLFNRTKAYANGTNTKGTFPIEKFLTEGKMAFQDGTNFESKEVVGMYKVFNKQDQTSTFYKIKIQNLGSENMYSVQYNGMREKMYKPSCPKEISDDKADNWTGQEEY